MNAILRQDHYSLLEVSRFAAKSEIVKAYHRLRAAFDPDSVATYSLFEPEEAKIIAARVEEAFRVLIDERKKDTYDRWLDAKARGEDVSEPVFARDAANDQAVATAVSTSGTTEVKPFTPRKVPVLRPVPPGGFVDRATPATAQASARAAAIAPPEIATPAAAMPAVTPAAELAPPAAAESTPSRSPRPRLEASNVPAAGVTAPVVTGPPIGAKPMTRTLPPINEAEMQRILAMEKDGPFFTALREARGMTVAQIAEITKISTMYLRFIEENNYRDMPAPVYLRGFLVQLARFHKLEAPDSIAEAYTALADRRKKESS